MNNSAPYNPERIDAERPQVLTELTDKQRQEAEERLQELIRKTREKIKD